MRRMLYLLLALFLWTAPAQAVQVGDFDTDFETCTTLTVNVNPCEGWRWFNDTTAAKSEVVISSSAIFGSKVVRGTWNNVNGSSPQPSMYHDMTGDGHFFVRFVAEMASGFQIGSNNYTKLFRIITAKAATSSTAPAFMYPTMHMMLRGSPPKWIFLIEQPYTSPTSGGGSGVRGAGGTPVWTNGPTVRQGLDDVVEVEVQLNTPGQANGFLRAWVNGTQWLFVPNMEIVGPNSTSRNGQGYLNSSTWTPDTAQFFVQSGVGTILWDRVAICAARCPAYGTPPPQDTTAPTPPTDVAAQ